MRRYSETRRPHPMAGGGLTVAQAIRRERQALAELRERADRVIETSALSVHELREVITAAVLGSRRGTAMAIELVSFGYKYGMPIGLDIVQDVRFIPNPFFVEDLRPLTGLDPGVREWVLAQPAAQEFLRQFEALLAPCCRCTNARGAATCRWAWDAPAADTVLPCWPRNCAPGWLASATSPAPAIRT